MIRHRKSLCKSIFLYINIFYIYIFFCFRAFLNAYEDQSLSSSQKALQDGEMIELSSDDEKIEDNKSNFQAWYSEYLRKLERKYPVAFDHTIKEGLTSNLQEIASKRSVLKMALGSYHLATYI